MVSVFRTLALQVPDGRFLTSLRLSFFICEMDVSALKLQALSEKVAKCADSEHSAMHGMWQARNQWWPLLL